MDSNVEKYDGKPAQMIKCEKKLCALADERIRLDFFNLIKVVPLVDGDIIRAYRLMIQQLQGFDLGFDCKMNDKHPSGLQRDEA